MLEVEVVVKGQISDNWSEWFENMRITHPQADLTMLVGKVIDQAALHGILSHLWDLGLPLVSVRTGPGGTGALRALEKTIYPNVRAIIERDTPGGKEIVLHKRNQAPEVDEQVELPGGQAEPSESLVDALRRNVREETGLELTGIEGCLEGRVESSTAGANVEYLAPLFTYQTLRGPVDSLGVFFRCRARGELLSPKEDAGINFWTPVRQIAEWLRECEQRFSWVDRAGLLYYLGSVINQKAKSEK